MAAERHRGRAGRADPHRRYGQQSAAVVPLAGHRPHAGANAAADAFPLANDDRHDDAHAHYAAHLASRAGYRHTHGRRAYRGAS